MYFWKHELGIIGNVKALIGSTNTTDANTENYHASDVVEINKNKTAISETETAACELDELYDASIADIENALCELDN